MALDLKSSSALGSGLGLGLGNGHAYAVAGTYLGAIFWVTAGVLVAAGVIGMVMKKKKAAKA